MGPTKQSVPHPATLQDAFSRACRDVADGLQRVEELLTERPFLCPGEIWTSGSCGDGWLEVAYICLFRLEAHHFWGYCDKYHGISWLGIGGQEFSWEYDRIVEFLKCLLKVTGLRSILMTLAYPGAAPSSGSIQAAFMVSTSGGGPNLGHLHHHAT